MYSPSLTSTYAGMSFSGSLKALHRKLFGDEAYPAQKNEEIFFEDAYLDSDHEIVHTVWNLVHICSLSGAGNFGVLVSDFLSWVGIGDPHGVVFHHPIKSKSMHGHNFHLGAGISDELLVAIMRLLKKYLMDDSVKIIDIASQALRGILSTENGQRALLSFDSYQRSLIEMLNNERKTYSHAPLEVLKSLLCIKAQPTRLFYILATNVKKDGEIVILNIQKLLAYEEGSEGETFWDLRIRRHFHDWEVIELQRLMAILHRQVNSMDELDASRDRGRSGSSSHNCIFTMRLWRDMFRWFEVSWVMPKSVKDLMFCWRSRNRRRRREALSLKNSTIWKTDGKTFETWICPLVGALIEYCDDKILRLCQDIVLEKSEVAELLFPHVMVNLSSRRVLDVDLCQLISSQVQKNILTEENKLTKSIQVILDALNELRLYHAMERGTSSNFSKRDNSKQHGRPSSYGSKSRSTPLKAKHQPITSSVVSMSTLSWEKVNKS
ncbi:hypothetical protein FXO38_21201 [Capsicum annuum]|nr:hypothetical protein FXO38_21201 [Capsicum annuum]KAF3671857.1 hypothetical protein FXO37_07811 [Capsicum annuum]